MSNVVSSEVKVSAQVNDIAARMAAITSKMTQSQKTIIAGQFEREAVFHALVGEIDKLETNLKLFNEELHVMDKGFESAKNHYRKLASTMDDYIAQSA